MKNKPKFLVYTLITFSIVGFLFVTNTILANATTFFSRDDQSSYVMSRRHNTRSHHDEMADYSTKEFSRMNQRTAHCH